MSTVWGLSLWLGVLVGFALTIVLALILGVPTLRLRADYLAIVTIAAAEIIRQTIGAAKFSGTFGGQDGLTNFIGAFRDLNPYTGGIDLGIVVVERLRLLGDDRRVGPRRAVLPDRLGADAQSLGPGAQVDPRGRGRRALARQERLRLQDAVADHRRHVRCARGLHGRAALGGDRPVVLRHRRHVLRLHRAADRRRGAGARPGARRGHLLVPAPGARPVLRPGHQRARTRSSPRRS